MNSNTLFYILILIISVSFILDKVLDLLNAKHYNDKIPDELNVVPTLIEAEDLLEMEAIERDLGF